MDLPSSFFKYVPFERKDILENGMIRFTPAIDFNDPFELTPTISHLTKKRIDICDKKSASQSTSFNDNDYDFSMKRYHQLEEKTNLFKKKMQKIGILRLTSSNNINELLPVSMPDSEDPRRSLIMWAYYANLHHGFIIEFYKDFTLKAYAKAYKLFKDKNKRKGRALFLKQQGHT